MYFVFLDCEQMFVVYRIVESFINKCKYYTNTKKKLTTYRFYAHLARSFVKSYRIIVSKSRRSPIRTLVEEKHEWKRDKTTTN